MDSLENPWGTKSLDWTAIDENQSDDTACMKDNLRI